MLLHSQFLPIDENAVGVDELPLGLIRASLVGASDWLSVLELLLHAREDCAALETLEGANVELWLDFSGPSDCAMDRHESAKDVRLQISDLLNLRQVVETDAEEFVLCILLSLFVHELSEPLSQIGFMFVVLDHNSFIEVVVSELEFLQVAVIYEHRAFLVCSHLLCLVPVIENWLVLINAFCVRHVVRVCGIYSVTKMLVIKT